MKKSKLYSTITIKEKDLVENCVFKEKVEKYFPFPIAYRFTLMKEEVNSHRKLLFMLDVFEVTVRHIALVLTSDYLRRLTKSDQMDSFYIRRLLKNVSLGDWVQIIRETVRFYWDQQQTPFIESLLDIYLEPQEKFKFSEVARYAEDFVNFRNLYKGHGVVEDEDTYEKLYEDNIPKLEKFLQAFECFSEYQLVVPSVSEEGIEYLICQGNSPKFKTSTELSLPIQDMTFFEETVWLVKKDQHLLLWPFTVFSIGKIDEVYMYDGAQLHKSGEIRQIKYLGFQKNIAHLMYRKGKEGGDALSYLNSYFKEKCYQLQNSLKQHHVKEVDYYFDSIKADLEFHTKNFVGRSDIIQKINNFCQENQQGFFIIQGVPGQGKSALLANIVSDYNFSHHFIKQGGIRANVSRFLQSLCQQIQKKYHINQTIPANYDEIVEYFETLLQKISHEYLLPKDEYEVIVIDAIDELAEEDRETLKFLPRYLPENVYIILSSRPLHYLQHFSFQVPYHIYDLEPLTKDEIKKLLLRTSLDVSDNVVDNVQRISAGNPLYLRLLIEESRWEVDIQKLPSGVENLFEQILSRIKKNRQSDDLIAVLSILTVAKRGLTIKELSSILGFKKRFTKSLIEMLESFIIDRNGELSIFHLKFEEYLLSEELEEDEIIDAHKSLIDYCLPWEDKSLSYGYDFLVDHFIAIKDYDSLFKLIESDFIKAKIDYYQSREACLKDLKQAFSSALKIQDPTKILQYGLLYILNCKVISEGFESGAFLINAFQGEIDSIIRDLMGIANYKTRAIALISLGEICLRNGDQQKAREILEDVFAQEKIQFTSDELKWLSKFIGEFVIGIDQALAIRLLKLGKGIAADNNNAYRTHIKDIIEVLINFANKSDKPADVLLVAFTVSEVIKEMEPEPLGKWKIPTSPEIDLTDSVLVSKTVISTDPYITEGRFQSEIVRLMIPWDCERAQQLAEEIRHPAYKAYAYSCLEQYFIDKNHDKAEYYKDEVAKIEKGFLEGKAFIYLQILRSQKDKNNELFQKCLDACNDIQNSEEREMLLHNLLPMWIDSDLPKLCEYLQQITNKGLYLCSLTSLGKNLYQSGNQKEGKELLLQALKSDYTNETAEYHTAIIKDVSLMLKDIDQEIFDASLELINKISVLQTKAKSLLFLASGISEYDVEKSENIFCKALDIAKQLNRKWEREEIFTLFLNTLMKSHSDIWQKFIDQIFPEISSLYGRTVAITHSYYVKKHSPQLLFKEAGSNWSLSPLANSTLNSWLATHFYKNNRPRISYRMFKNYQRSSFDEL